MKKKLIFVLFAVLILGIGTINAQDKSTEFPVLKGKYLGQKPPGLTPAIFAPGIISGELSEGSSGWGKDMEYFIFQRWIDRKPVHFIMYNNEGTWSKPESVSVLDEYLAGDLMIGPDGKTMVFASRKVTPQVPEDVDGGCNIWITTKTKNSWTTPIPVGAPINTKYHDSYPDLAANKNMYFFSRKPGGFGKSDLYMSVYKDGNYLEPVNLGKTLNTPEHEWDTYITPDESYMIYCSTGTGSLGKDDLFITYKTKDGSWSKPIHMGDKINTDASENRPYVTPDGKYLFYTSTKTGKRDIYWVDAKILETFKE